MAHPSNPLGERLIVDVSISAERVVDSQRLEALPRHFGRFMLIVERAVYSTLEHLSSDYHGGYWHFYELSNGGFYMAPDGGPLRIEVQGNDFGGVLSADAAGIVACLFAYSRLSFKYQSDVLAEHYHQLREFALDHADASLIMSAID